MLIAQRPTLTEESLNPQRSRFVIEPLEPGFGYTLGNSLRRTLLSSIPGAAGPRSAFPARCMSSPLLASSKIWSAQHQGIVLTSGYDKPVVMPSRKSSEGGHGGGITPPAGIPSLIRCAIATRDVGELEISSLST